MSSRHCIIVPLPDGLSSSADRMQKMHDAALAAAISSLGNTDHATVAALAAAFGDSSVFELRFAIASAQRGHAALRAATTLVEEMMPPAYAKPVKETPPVTFTVLAPYRDASPSLPLQTGLREALTQHLTEMGAQHAEPPLPEAPSPCAGQVASHLGHLEGGQAVLRECNRVCRRIQDGSHDITVVLAADLLARGIAHQMVTGRFPVMRLPAGFQADGNWYGDNRLEDVEGAPPRIPPWQHFYLVRTGSGPWMAR